MADAFGRVGTGDIALIFDSMAVRNGDGDFIKNHNELCKIIRPSEATDVVEGYKLGERATGDIFLCRILGTDKDLVHVHRCWLRYQSK